MNPAENRILLASLRAIKPEVIGEVEPSHSILNFDYSFFNLIRFCGFQTSPLPCHEVLVNMRDDVVQVQRALYVTACVSVTVFFFSSVTVTCRQQPKAIISGSFTQLFQILLRKQSAVENNGSQVDKSVYMICCSSSATTRWTETLTPCGLEAAAAVVSYRCVRRTRSTVGAQQLAPNKKVVVVTSSSRRRSFLGEKRVQPFGRSTSPGAKTLCARTYAQWKPLVTSTDNGAVVI